MTTTTTTNPVQFARTSRQDGATETLTLVRLPAPVYCEYLERECEFGVQVTAGEGDGSPSPRSRRSTPPRFRPSWCRRSTTDGTAAAPAP